MCGIYGFVSSPPDHREVAVDSYFEEIDSLLAIGADASRLEGLPETEQGAFLATLRTALSATYAWVQREGFLRVLRDEDLQRRLQETASRVTSWTETLSGLSAGLHRQRDRELINQLIVGGRDIAWQLRCDCLDNLEPVRRLVRLEDDAPAPDGLLAHGWQLGLVLSGLNRLEVRGRDSAGIAVYARFPGVGSLESFLDGPVGGVGWRRELASRSASGALTHLAVTRPTSRDDTLLFVFKVASEIGRMGDNVRHLRQAIMDDRLFQAALREPEVDIQCLAHTRWASNGIISESNCHPVDSASYRTALDESRSETSRTLEDSGEILAVLNGDIDNYQELLGVYLERLGVDIDPAITTDAKIIPLAINYHFRETGDLLEAFHRAFAEFEGSMAIGIMAADRPGEYVFGQKGSGQGLFLGVSDGAIAVASEMYGLVEFSQRYVKAEGESVEGGEVFHLDARAPGEVKVRRSTFDPRTSRIESRELDPSRVRTAEITTRDINRGEHSHFLAKEISESVDSVRKTISGKFELTGDNTVRSLLGEDVLPPDLLEAIRAGRVRRIVVIGQGTAAVAGQGVAHLLEGALAGADASWQIGAMKATELSGHHMSPDMSDALIIAISQSGTTTDTNRTVDMARERGGWIIAIVNRRNSDLVYKSHGVLYTSDGRDIEMSVASTKAFYAQNVAGQVLALALALELGALAPDAAAEELRQLERLPDVMRETLALDAEVKALAETHALRRRYWALVGSGAAKIAADEVRIKLSELCYKSIASDFLEDKKHIDLSSEPLILVCAGGAPPQTISDIVKEVAIFKAHSAIPLVITDRGESRFDAYAAGTIKLPPYEGRLGYLLSTMVGHLFGYHAAASFDRVADSLRRVRTEVVELAGLDHAGDGSAAGDRILPTRIVDGLPDEVTRELADLNDWLRRGNLDSGLDAGVATRLGEAIGFLLGRYPADALGHKHRSFLAALLAHLSDAINQLARPIDAIKHQAKTVTVGVSRTEETAYRGRLWDAYRDLGLEPEAVAESHRRVVAALDPLVHSVEGVTLYRVTGLDPMGRPTDESRVSVLAKKGCAAKILSRCEESQPLSGTKWGVVKRREIYLGYGKNDSRKIFVVPAVAGEGGHIALFHLDLVPFGRLEDRMSALQAYERHHERLRIAVTEGSSLPWGPERLEGIDNDTLFFATAEKAAAAILERSASASASPSGLA